MDNLKFNSLSGIELIILILVLAIIFLILYLEPRLSKSKLKNNKEHGSSKFADMKEIKKTFDKENINNLEKAGFPVWYSKKNGKIEDVYFDNKSPHHLLIGSTGSGKSVTVVLPECLMFAQAKEKHSVVVTDPKGEIFRKTGSVFEANGYKVLTLDFRNPTKSNRLNIMQPIIKEWKEYCSSHKAMLFLISHFLKHSKVNIEKLMEDGEYLKKIKSNYYLDDYLINVIKDNIREIEGHLNSKKMYNTDILNKYIDIEGDLKKFLLSKDYNYIFNKILELQNKSSSHEAETNRLVIGLADLIFVDDSSGDKFWINSAKQLFIGITGVFLEDYRLGLINENQINISSVKKFQNSSLIKENQMYLQRNINSRRYGCLSKDYLTSILSAAENTYKSITAVFGEKMAIFDDLNVENITSISEFEITEIGSKPTALFLIVPDEDRAYYQLVTIIVGMMTNVLTKFANLEENKGALPVMVEWILDEFCNAPRWNIETQITVARSRRMRYQMFIQSFSQLDQVYGKEVADIIKDNAALTYLKTNSVEVAEVIQKKLGRATIETSSLSQSTDPMKIGGNKTLSLMGKDLLTATEIIALKYKTIIFPTISNPIFRDTYMYSDIYPQFTNVEELYRKVQVLKRITSNYYTVENLKSKYDELNKKHVESAAKQFQQSINKNMKKSIDQITKEFTKEESKSLTQIEIFVNDLISKLTIKNNVVEQLLNDDGSYSITTNNCLNLNDINKMEKYIKEDYTFSLSRNINKQITKILIWNNKMEKKI